MGEFEATEQALVRSRLVAKVPEASRPERAVFRQGDACDLGDIGQVDCITAVNLLCVCRTHMRSSRRRLKAFALAVFLCWSLRTLGWRSTPRKTSGWGGRPTSLERH